MEINRKRNIITLWFFWFYFKVPREIMKGWGNYLKFGLYYFSMDSLLKTFFSPWRGYLWEYPRGVGLGDVEAFISNLFSRLIGAIMRTFLIIGGLIAEIIIFLLGIIVFLLWLVLPVILILGLLIAFILI